MLSIIRARHLSLTALMLGMSAIAGCGAASGEPGDQGDVEGDEIGSAESALTVTLPSVFTATMQNASHNGSTNECLMFYGGAQSESPSRYMWGSDNGNCGFDSKASLLANKQAVWKFTRMSGDQYTISHAAGDGSTNACLMFYGVDPSESPTRYLWGNGDNGYCGFASKAEVLANKQAVWKVTPRGGNKFTISDGLTNECLIFSGNGQNTNPTRHLWDDGDNGKCGWDSEANLLANKQAIWTITVQETLDLSSASCADVKAQYLDADDGDYTIAVAGGPATLYCADMAGTPKEYLALEHTGGASNYAKYTAGGASPGSDVVTHYEKVRIDPSTLAVDISDQRFATSTGQLSHAWGETVTSMPYGVAMSCDGIASGQANIDLRGTSFSVAPNEFVQGGYAASGAATYSGNNQVVDLGGGGYCGWTNPAPYIYNPFNGNGGFQLNLVYSAN